jgi:hypothetical protein
VSFCLISVAIIDTAPSSDFTSKIRPGKPSNLNGPLGIDISVAKKAIYLLPLNCPIASWHW